MAGGRIEIDVVPNTKGFPGKVASGLKGLQGIGSTIGKGLGVAVAAGAATAAIGLKSVISLGIEYTGKLNEMQAVSGATAIEMAQVGAKAKALGADLSLPATSAAGAAAAMLELSKGGLSVSQSMIAAKGTLQLAAAAQVEAATAAEIQSNALNEFGLSADKAGKVADVLANTANAASGGILDIANALKYVGPIARSLGITITDTAAAIGLLANNGIQSEQAGTSLRSMLASLASPSKAAAKAMDVLNLSAFDEHGKFVGLTSIIGQLNKAKKNLTDETFQNAAANAFGNEALSAVNALANEGATAFKEMAVAVDRQGGASDVAAAKMKGLGGAWEGFKSQLETAGIEIFDTIDGPLESIVRKASDVVSKLTPAVKKGIDSVISAGQLFGPELATALASRGEAMGEVAAKLLRPLVEGVKDTLNNGLQIGIQSVQDFAGVLKKAADVAQPLADGIGRIITSVNRADGPIGAFGAALGIAYDAAKGVLGILAPVIGIVGGLVGAFADLPGPIQTAAIALLALKVGPSILGSLKSAFSSAGKDADDAEKKTGIFGKTVGLLAAPVKLVASGVSTASTAVKTFGENMQVQRSLAAASGEDIGRLSGAYAVVQSRVAGATQGLRESMDSIQAGAVGAGEPVSRLSAGVQALAERSPALAGMRDAFHGAADGAGAFGKAAGIAAAAGSGIKSAASGLVGALGGPFGLAIAGASLGLGLLAGNQEEAARRAEEHRKDVDSLTSALRDSDGAITDSIRSQRAQELQSRGTAEQFKGLGVDLTELTAATLKQGSAYDDLHDKLHAIALANSDLVADPASGNITRQFNDQGIAANNMIKILEDYGSKIDEAQRKQKELREAVKNGTASMLDASDSGRTFAKALKDLAQNAGSADDKARSLKDILDAFSGGQVGLDEALSHVNEQFDRLRDSFTTNGTAAEVAALKAKGFGDTLLTSAGRINTTTENGRRLRDSLEEITTSTVNVAQRTFDMTGSIDAAKQVVQDARDRFIAMADKMGINATQAGILADQMGLIPDQVITAIEMPGMTDAQKEILLFQGILQRTPPGKDVVIKSLTDEAKAKLEEFGFKVTTLKDGQISVHAETAAAAANVDSFVAQQSRKRIVITVATAGSARLAKELNSLPNHDGNILRAFAGGGLAGLTPMKGGVASIVPPNTWRIVGDRLRDDEAYIPINQSARSLSILQQTADQMGFALLRRFATGGVAVGKQQSPQKLVTPTSFGGDTFIINEQNDPMGTALYVQRQQAFKARLR